MRYMIGWMLAPLAVSGALPTPACAQAASAQEPATGAVDDIIVTAQRREESLQSVPVSITAITAEKLERGQIQTLQDYAAQVPNFKASNLGAPGRTDISIRGVSNIGGQASSVAVYYDEFGVSASDGIGFDADIFDLERIEVLRGPQGTLFGRNTIGGAVNLVLKRPSNRNEASAAVEYGRFDTVLGQFMVNVPIIDDRLLLRANLVYRRSDGYIRDIGPAENTDGFRRLSGRVALRYTDGPLSLDLNYLRSTSDQGIATQVPTGVLAPAVLGIGITQPIDSGQGFFPTNRRTIATDQPNFNERDTETGIARVTYDFGAATAVLIAGFQKATLSSGGDFDRTPFLLTTNVGNVGTNELYSVEARLQSNGRGGFNWLIGAAYNEDMVTDRGLTVFQPDFLDFLGVPTALAPFRVFDQTQSNKTITKALFGQIGWSSPDDALTVAFAGRYTSDRLHGRSDDQSQSFVDGLPVNLRFDARASYGDFTPRGTVSYRLSAGINVYATVSRGYKSGGFNQATVNIPGLPASFGKETAWNYEAGIKTELLDRKLRVNLSVFQMDWNDIQVLSRYQGADLVFRNLTQNAASARLRGFEVEALARPAAFLDVDAALGFNDGRFGKFDTAVNEFGIVEPASGNRLPNASKWQVSANAEIHAPVAGTTIGFARAEWSYTSDFYQTLQNRNQIGDRVEGVSYFNVRAGLRSARHSVSIFAENLGGSGHAFNWDVNNFLSGIQAVVRPERYGVRFSAAF